MTLRRPKRFECLNHRLRLVLASAYNSRGSGIELAQVGERVYIFAVELDRTLKFAAYLLGQAVGFYGMDGVGFFAICPAQPEVIRAIQRRKLDRGLALVDGIIPSLSW